MYRLFENTHLFTTVTATDRSGFSQCYNFPSEKTRSSSGSEHHLLDHMHRQLSVVSACIPLVIVKNTGMVPNGLVNVKKEVKHSNANGNNVSIDVLFLGYGQK